MMRTVLFADIVRGRAENTAGKCGAYRTRYTKKCETQFMACEYPGRTHCDHSEEHGDDNLVAIRPVLWIFRIIFRVPSRQK